MRRAGTASRICGLGRRRADAARLLALATERIAAEPRAKLDYLEIVDPVTLDPLVFVDGPATIVAAVWFGDVRLIDNLPLLA